MRFDYFPIREGDAVVNLGAHQGGATLFFASHVGKNGRVVSIEPMEENFRMLQEAVNKVGYTNVTLFNAAIGNKTGEGLLYTGTNSVNYSIMRDHGRGATPTKTLTWDSLMDLAKLNYVSLAKIDVEGAELQCFEGMTRQLPRHIIMEEHSRFGYDINLLLDALKNKGYTYAKSGMDIYATRED